MAPVVERLLPSAEAEALMDMVRDVCANELAPLVTDAEESGQFPRDAFRMLGDLGLLSLPYPQEWGGGDQPYEVYLQVLEELARTWLSVGMGVSVHVLSCFPVAAFGSPQQREEHLPRMLSGSTLGAYCLSEPHSGSDAAALTTAAVRTGDAYVVDGVKAWITHGGEADFYNLMVRTSAERTRGISCLLADADTPGLSAAPAERKMALNGSRTSQIILQGATVPADRLIGEEGQGFQIAMEALDGGRLGIAACAVGVAQAALDVATDYARNRQQFGQAIGDFQGIGFMLADMATAVASSRALYLHAARLRDAGRPFGIAAAQAKLAASEAAMRVATDAVQVLGGAGYTRDFPAERLMREAKLLSIVEGTSGVQRLVIGRAQLHAQDGSRRGPA